MLHPSAAEAKAIVRAQSALLGQIDFELVMDDVTAHAAVPQHSSWLAFIVKVGPGNAGWVFLEEAREGERQVPALALADDIDGPTLRRAVQNGCPVLPADDSHRDIAVEAFLARLVKRSTPSMRLAYALIRAYGLSGRHERIVHLAAHRKKRAAISIELNMSPNTFDEHAKAIRRITGCRVADICNSDPAALLVAFESALRRNGALTDQDTRVAT